MTDSDNKYDYDRFGSKGKRVGQAVADILSKDQPTYSAEDIIEGYKEKFEKSFHEAVEGGIKQGLKYPFYIYVMQHKEFWADNVVRNWFIPRQTPPHALDMIEKYPHHNKILYMVNPESNQIKICWNIPGYEDCKSILKNPAGLSSEMIKWIKDAMAGKLNRDSYEFDKEYLI